MAFIAKNKKWFGYILYVALVTIILLYFLFPVGEVEEFVDNSVSRVSPRLSFTADRIGPWLPPGLRFVGPKIHVIDKSQSPYLRLDVFYIGPQVLNMLTGGNGFRFNGQAYNGEINGWLEEDKSQGGFAGEINFRDLDLASHDILGKELAYKIIGTANGNIIFNRESQDPEDLSGNAAFRLSDGKLQLMEPIFGIGSVDMKNVVFDLELNNRQVNFVKAELAGSEIKGSVSGSIQLQRDFKQSRLNLKGTLEPLAEFYKNNPGIRELLKNMKKRVRRGQYLFSITGTLADPRFKLL
jgi:type II secretion system protein N